MQTELAFHSLKEEKEEEKESHNSPKLIAPVFSSSFTLKTVLIVWQVTLKDLLLSKSHLEVWEEWETRIKEQKEEKH